MSTEDIRNILSTKGLKVTPQRMSILNAVYELGNHPTAENIIEYIHEGNPGIAKGTVYNVLDTLLKNKLIIRVKTENDLFRYDGITEQHHHLYCSECDLIEDYSDPELDTLLDNYFKKKRLKGFKIEDIVVQIRGTFDKC